jgi:hypothetical protein
VAWGEAESGGDASKVISSLGSGVRQLFSSWKAFAALKSDGSVVTWGNPNSGGESTSVASKLRSGVIRIYSTYSSFAALKFDGSVVTWGNPSGGGDSSSVEPKLRSGIKQIYASGSAFAAIKADGSLVTWGDSARGGNSSLVDINGPRNDLIVKEINSNAHGFTALLSDGSIVMWGGFYREIPNEWYLSKNSMTEGKYLKAKSLALSTWSFAALQSDGSLAFANYDTQYQRDYPDIDFDGPLDNLKIIEIYASNFGFAAIRNDNSIVTWGTTGSSDNVLDSIALNSSNHKVLQVVSSLGSFAALLDNGSVVTWGNKFDGGDSSGVDFNGNSNNLIVTKLISNRLGFSALRSDGSVVYWGMFENNNDGGTIPSWGPGEAITRIFTTAEGGFAGIRDNGSVVTWGQQSYGGNSKAVDFDGPNNNLKVVGFANPFTDDRLVYFTPLKPYTPSPEDLEILAKDVVYQDFYSEGAFIAAMPGFPYKIDKIWNDFNTGLFAFGLTAANASSILVFRGTGDKFDIWDDLNINGIGYKQFTANRDSLRDWIFKQGSSIPPVITGHSLGGALAQWLAADVTANGGQRLSEVVTFNSPGIAGSRSFQNASIGADAFKASLVGKVTHYITSSDIVSLGGSKYIQGDFKLFDYGSLPDPGLGQHLNPVLVGSLPISGKTRASEGGLKDRPFWFLNSPVFGYNIDLDFIVLRLTIAGIAKASAAFGGPIGVAVANILGSLNRALDSRSRTEQFRQTIGATLFLYEGIKAGLESALSFASVAAESATERVQSAIESITKGGKAALDAIDKLADEAWDQFSSLSASTWNSLSNWTNNAWKDAAQWGVSTWQTLSTPVFDFAKPFITSAVKQAFSLAAPPIARRFAALSSFDQSVALDQPQEPELFQVASLAAPASTATIDVTVALSQASSNVVTLNYQTVDQTAIAGVDYTPLSGSLTFQPGETEKIVTIELLDIASLQNIKQLAVRISNLQNSQILTSNDIIVSIGQNQTPIVATPPTDQFAPVGEPLFFSLPPDTFTDANISNGDQLSYSATLADGSPLPSWLRFDPSTQSFAGIPPFESQGNHTVTVTATDSAFASTSATINLKVVVNDGVATFAITGSPAVSSILTVTNSTPDPDGNGAFSYFWQSFNGSSWDRIGNDATSYALTSVEAGRQVRVLVAYSDAKGFSELLTTDPVTVLASKTAKDFLDPSTPLDLQPGRTCSLPGLRDYDGILHGGAPEALKNSIAADYRFQGLFSLRRDGLKQAVFTNRSSGRWASAAVDPITRQIDYADHGNGGITRVVGIYDDPLVKEGEQNTARPGYLLSGEKAPERFGPFDSQRRFQNDLLIDNLSARLAGDFDNDGIQELYWKVNDGTAYLRSLLHDDGNIRYANYQSRDQMTSYLSSNGHADLIASVL